MKLDQVLSTPPPNRRLAIEHIAIDDLRFNPRNPRRHSPKKIAKLAESLGTLGLNGAVRTDADLMILAGEALVRAAKVLGWTEVPVIRLDHLSPAQAEAYMIADNRIAELSENDPKALGAIFRDLAKMELDFSLEITGFEMGEIDFLIEGLETAPEAEESLEDLEPQGPPVTRVGDRWVLENHRILCGDAQAPESYAALMQDRKAAAIITDPPYGGKISGYLPGQGKTQHREFVMGSEGLSDEGLETFLTPVMAQIARHASEGALIYVFMDWRGIETLLRVGRKTFSELKNIICWAKTNAGMGTLYRSQHELIALFKNGQGRHRNNVQLGRMGRYRTNLWSYAGMTSASARSTEEGDLLALHPTVKPVGMIADAILDCTARGDVVLDPFLGSGTSLIAAERVGRRCYGLELDPLYVDVAVRRWQRLTGKTAVHAESGMAFDDVSAEREVSHG